MMNSYVLILLKEEEEEMISTSGAGAVEVMSIDMFWV
jgi:hypothetical protein